MAISQVLRKLGQWSLKLRADAPPGVVGALEMLGHVAVLPGRISPTERGDELLSLARFVGVLRSVGLGDRGMTLSGSGLEYWLGDEDGAGPVLEAPGIALSGASFSAAMTALLPADGSVTAGTAHTGVPGTITTTRVWETSRTALDWVCAAMGGEWRINGNGTLDTGPAASLFRISDPTCVIVRKGSAGYDLTLKALAGDLESTRDGTTLATRVVVVGEGLATGSADVPSTPYRHLHGAAPTRTRLLDEQNTTEGANATARAAAALDLFSGVRRQLRLRVDEYDVAGDFQPGDVVWAYDPAAGVYDLANEVQFRGQTIYPMPVRVLAVTWPVTAGHTVGFRGSDGTWTDLTAWVDWESAGGGEVEVADSFSASLVAGIGSIGTTIPGGGGGAGDPAVPDVPTFGTFTTTAYQPGDGLSRASVKVAWTQPLNTDASTIVDGDHYEVRYRQTGTTDWAVAFASFDQTSLTVIDLPPSTGYDWQIRAVDYASPQNFGAWSATTTFSTAADTTAPATPAPPTVAASLIAVQITHTLGLASGGTYNLPLDLDHLEIHVGSSAGFTPSGATLAGKLTANAGMLTGGIAAVGTFPTSSTAAVHVKVVAVDRTGNRSTASSAASATAALVDSAHISDLTASKITAGTFSATYALAGQFETAASGKRVVVGAGGVQQYDASGVLKVNLDNVTGNATFGGSLSAATGTFSGALSAATGSFSGTITGSTITGGTVQTAASGARVVISAGSSDRITFYSASGDDGYIRTSNTGGTDEIGFYSGSGAAYLLANNLTCSLNAASGVVSASHLGAVMVNTSTGDQVAVTGGDVGISTISGTVDVSSPTTIVGHAGEVLALGATTINLSNITTGTGVNLVHISRRMYIASSARRFKRDIRPAVIDPADVLSLEPITYLDKSAVDENGGSLDGVRRHYGFVADDYADGPLDTLVHRDDDGEPFSFAYDRVPVLQQAVLREHAAQITELAAEVADLRARVEANR